MSIYLLHITIIFRWFPDFSWFVLSIHLVYFTCGLDTLTINIASTRSCTCIYHLIVDGIGFSATIVNRNLLPSLLLASDSNTIHAIHQKYKPY